MNPYNIVILSDSTENLSVCLEPLQSDHVIIGCHGDSAVQDYAHKNSLLTFSVPRPFSFARAANIGIGLCRTVRRDVILLNDDAVLITKDGFSNLAFVARNYLNFGVVSAAIEGEAKKDQRPQPNRFIRYSMDAALAFICVYIRVEIFDSVGVLDESFGPDSYGFEDNDFCHRVSQAGYNLGILDSCVVRHGLPLKSTYRCTDRESFAKKLREGARIFRTKWGEEVAKVHMPQSMSSKFSTGEKGEGEGNKGEGEGE